MRIALYLFYRFRGGIVGFCMLLSLTTVTAATLVPTEARAQSTPYTANPSWQPEAISNGAVSWLEPRAINVLDFVGQVPEEHLKGSILTFGQAGTTRYVSGYRDGDKVVINVSMDSWVYNIGGTIVTMVTCLGHYPTLDHWPVPVPASTMRIYSNGADVTNQVRPHFSYAPFPQAYPLYGSNGKNGGPRYYFDSQELFTRATDGSLIIPANTGCDILFAGRMPNLTATYVFDYPQQIHIEPLGSETFTFHSYTGIGEAGMLASLRDQMKKKYGTRHDEFYMNIPEGADYVWLNYPPTPISLYSMNMTDENINLPFGGTYRFYADELSNDHMVSMGIPIYQQWQDTDLDEGKWLEPIGKTARIQSPEYFVLRGTSYDPCMTNGACPDSLLDQIYNAEDQMTLYFYKVSRLANSQLVKIPLYSVGPDWQSGDTPYSASASYFSQFDSVETRLGDGPVYTVLVPGITYEPSLDVLPEDAPDVACPCGWFDQNYRMLDVVPGLP